MDLAGVQARVRVISPGYVHMFDWRQEGDVVKAFPKRKMSAMAFKLVKKVFKQLGGKFCFTMKEGCWFEVVLRAEQCGFRHATSNETPKGITGKSISPAVSGSVLSRLQTQLISVVTAGEELLNARPT